MHNFLLSATTARYHLTYLGGWVCRPIASPLLGSTEVHLFSLWTRGPGGVASARVRRP